MSLCVPTEAKLIKCPRTGVIGVCKPLNIGPSVPKAVPAHNHEPSLGPSLPFLKAIY